VFTYYNVLFNIDKVKNLGEGTTFAEISKTALSTVELDFPTSLPEQTKIAEILSTVDRAIEQTAAFIAKQQRIKTGLMQDLLTSGINEHGNIRSEQTHKFKDSPLGRIPVEWKVFEINTMCSDIVDCPHTTPIYKEHGIPCIRTADMQPGHLLLDTAFCVDETSYQDRVSRLVVRFG
jgi:type I restriction enzyme, S subunit